MLQVKFGRKVAALGISAVAFAGVATAAPAQAAPTGANTVYADCAVGSYGENSDGVWISCGDVVGGQARGRADCKGAPDIYTAWVGAGSTPRTASVGSACGRPSWRPRLPSSGHLLLTAGRSAMTTHQNSREVVSGTCALR